MKQPAIRERVPRFRIKVRLDCVLQDSKENPPVLFYTENLSQHGMRIIKEGSNLANVALGQSQKPHHFELQFDPNKAPIQMIGQIVYFNSEKSAFGIKFVTMENEHAATLARLIARKSTEEPDIIIID